MMLLWIILSLSLAIFIYFILIPRLRSFVTIWKGKFVIIRTLWGAGQIKSGFQIIFCGRKDFKEILEGLELTEHDKIKKEFFKK